MTRRLPAPAVALVLLLAACSSQQDPGVVPSPPDGPATTSRPLPPCPPGGPDETTPEAGCLDADGNVVRD